MLLFRICETYLYDAVVSYSSLRVFVCTSVCCVLVFIKAALSVTHP